MKSLRLPILLALCAFAFACAKTEPVDETHQGTLEDGDSVIEHDDGSFYDHYTFRAKEGWQINITMSSDDFDTYLWLVQASTDTFSEDAVLIQNDDADGTNSAISLAAPVTGPYTVIANSFAAGETGAYTLRIVANEAGAAPAAEAEEEGEGEEEAAEAEGEGEGEGEDNE